MKKNSAIVFVLIFILVFWVCFASETEEANLSQKYKDWLKLTKYIMHEKEKDVFMQLESDRERDVFIEAFWRVRDPTPGTPQNEYKEEHIKRFMHVNERLRHGSPREGWMTDMGRIYIILGPPSKIDRFDETAGIYPCQVWYYYGDKAKGLPTYFGLVFYKRGGAGEYRLYNPASDGPASLIIDTYDFDQTNHYQVYQRIKELAPTLATISVSLIPGQYHSDYVPSPQSTIILANILESPKKEVRPVYATHFLNYKGTVTTEYLTNYVESITETAIMFDPVQGVNFLNFSISPKGVSVDYYEPKNQYFCNYKLSVSLRYQKKIIFQYSKDFPFYFSPDDLPIVQGKGIAVKDSFPLIEGNYKLDILLQNTVGKEFSVFEKDIVLLEETKNPRIIDLTIGYDLEDQDINTHVPFKIIGKKLLVDPQMTFSSSDQIVVFCNLKNITRNLWEEGELEIFVKGLSEKSPYSRSFSLKLKDYPDNEIMGITHILSVEELPADYYEMNVYLRDGRGELIDESKSEFIVSPAKNVPHPIIISKRFPLSENYIFFYTLASMYEKVEKLNKAEEYFIKAYDSNPDFMEGLIEYVNFAIKIKNFDEASRSVEGLKGKEDHRFDYCLLKGRILMGTENYAEAINVFSDGNKIYDSDTRLLNSMGFCYYKTNDLRRALEILNSSLHLNPGQKEIIELVKEIDRKINLKKK